MTPLLEIVLDAPVERSAVDAVVARVPPARRDRLVVAWPGAGAAPPLDLFASARAAGFKRVRLAAPAAGLSAAGVEAAAAAGCDEVQVRLPGEAPWDALGTLRASGRLAFVSVSAPPSVPLPGNPCGADERGVDGDPSGLDLDAAPFRRVAVRGMPVCLAARLDPARVISNAVRTAGWPPAPIPPFEDPARAWFAPCGRCDLALACDGLPWTAFRDGDGRVLHLQSFGPGETADVVLSPAGLAARVRPASWFGGRVHLLAVLAGARPCGRVVVPPADARREAARMQRLGLHTATVDPRDAPADTDPGATAGPGAAHLFFARDPATARAAADVERRYAAAEAGADPVGAARFARALGALLGYPGCCVESFVAAGPRATTAELLRAAHARSAAFHPELACLDPRSPFLLVPHLPCRFDCAPSTALARRVLAALPALFPLLDDAARRLLARDAVLLDDGTACHPDPPDAPAFRAGAPRDPAAAAFLARAYPALVRGTVPPGLRFPFGG